MRDLILFAALLLVVPLTLRAPIVGLLAWIWTGLMNPQREVYGFLLGFELNFIIAALTIVAWLVSAEPKRLPLNPFTLFLVLFGFWSTLAAYVALDPVVSQPLWEQTAKTLIMVLAVLALANTKARLQAVVWMCAVSMGYYAVKGGGFVLLTGGRHHVLGPENSMIEDNNCLGLMLVILLPLINYLRVTTRATAVKWACLAAMVLTSAAVVGTYSRGALLALGAAGVTHAIRGRASAKFVLLAGVFVLALPVLAPSTWFDRMSTIQSYDQDDSFEGRVAAWTTSLNIAKARPLTGGGFRAVERDAIVQQFRSPGSLEHGRAAHSIYFQVLGDTGFVGLALYLAMLGGAVANTVAVTRAVRGRPELAWADALARALQVCMVALLVGGAALSMAYYDGFLVMLALTAVLLHVVQTASQQTALPTYRRRMVLTRRADPGRQLGNTLTKDVV